MSENICTKLQAALLIFDSPEGPNGPVCPSPSARLRSIGIRIQLSGWVIPQRDMPYGLMAAMRDAGCTVDTVKFDASEGENLLTLAIRSIKMEIRKALEKARITRGRAEGRLTDS